MEIVRQTSDAIEANVSFLELEGIKNCLNDVWGALRLADFEAAVGADEDTVSALIDPMVEVLSAHFYGKVTMGEKGESLYSRRLGDKK